MASHGVYIMYLAGYGCVVYLGMMCEICMETLPGIDPYEVKDVAREVADRLGTGYRHGAMALSINVYEMVTRAVMEQLADRGRLTDD